LLPRGALLGTASLRDLFLKVLEQVRRRYQWVVIGYVVMPEHSHLLVSEPEERPLSTAMQALKLGFARRVLAEQQRHSRQGDGFDHSPRHVW
jgi:putative transposase